MRSVVLVLGVGCYSPSAQTGAPCDPEAPRCPDGQVCSSVAGGHVCTVPGTGDPDGGSFDAAVLVDANPLGHITVSPGWSVDVFQDFSASFTYVPIDFVDGPETYSNLPDWLFVLEPPFAPRLGLLAGRRVIELSGSTFTSHDYGQHDPNTGGRPDYLRGATYVANLDANGPALLVSSSSAGGGDGTFRITPGWNLSPDKVQNNTRGILFDPTGAFDERAVPEGYLGTQDGLVRRSDGQVIAPGDIKTMRLVGSDLLVTRDVGTTVQLVRITSKTHVETVLAEHATIRLGQGVPPSPYIAFAVVDQRTVVLVGPSGALVPVVDTTDPRFAWQAVAVPAIPHPLAGRIYLLEGNRDLDLDRVLAITPR
jgi:hypothetical protein